MFRKMFYNPFIRIIRWFSHRNLSHGIRSWTKFDTLPKQSHLERSRCYYDCQSFYCECKGERIKTTVSYTAHTSMHIHRNRCLVNNFIDISALMNNPRCPYKIFSRFRKTAAFMAHSPVIARVRHVVIYILYKHGRATSPASSTSNAAAPRSQGGSSWKVEWGRCNKESEMNYSARARALSAFIIEFIIRRASVSCLSKGRWEFCGVSFYCRFYCGAKKSWDDKILCMEKIPGGSMDLRGRKGSGWRVSRKSRSGRSVTYIVSRKCAFNIASFFYFIFEW